jgi:hypothetical protein
MTKEVISQIFKQYHGEEFNIHGLVVSLVSISLISGIYGFHFNFKNPNDVSYFDGIISYELENIVEEFVKYVSVENYVVHLMLDKNQEELYVNGEVRSKIKDYYDGIPYISFKVWIGTNTYPDEYRIYGKSKGIKLYWESDSYEVANKFKVLNATLNGEPISIESAISEYDVFLREEATYWETENIYIKMDYILSKYPLLWDSSWLATYYSTKFV